MTRRNVEQWNHQWSKILVWLGPLSEPTNENDLPTLMRGFPGKIRQLAWADLPPSADLPPILAAATRELVTMWMQSPEGWDSWVLDLHSETVGSQALID